MIRLDSLSNIQTQDNNNVMKARKQSNKDIRYKKTILSASYPGILHPVNDVLQVIIIPIFSNVGL